MELDHIAVTRLSGTTHKSTNNDGLYQVRAELKNLPPQEWRTKFQATWHDTPECRSLSSNLQVDGKSIFVRFPNSAQVPEIVTLLRNMMALDLTAHAQFVRNRAQVVDKVGVFQDSGI